ncbi:MAG TPA: SPOR domain-containing protein [Blastocatellia bacterium]|nr:SPOR domain-containing protein [Blastocatellia bacterium]
MRFRNFNFTKTLANMKEMWPAAGLALAALFVCLCPQIANAQAARIKGYSVQVAALSSQKSADELVKGLGVRGINAYWVKGGSLGPSMAASVHRVRIGNFQTIASANTYAEKLIGTGLLEAYAITAYESPAKDGSISNGKAYSSAQKNQGRPFNAEAIDMIAAIGARGWLLLSSKSIDLTLRQGRQGTQALSPLSRELSKLAAFVSSRGWGMNNNIAKLLEPATPANIASLASTRNWSIPTARGSGAVAINAAPSTVALTPPPAPAVAVNAAPSTVALTPPPRPEVTVNTSATSPAVASSVSFNAGSREIGGRPLGPAISTGVRPTGSKLNTAPPKLQGSLELRDGRMWLTLRNNDSDRSFMGLARVSLRDDKSEQDVTPMMVTLGPDKEESFPVDEAKFKDGSWTLMVFDQNGAARLIRGSSFPAPPKPGEAVAASKSPSSPGAPSAPSPTNQIDADQGPPSYVTGVYDATWARPQAPPEGQEAAQQNAPAPAPDPATTQNTAGAAAPNAGPPTPPPGPGDVTVVPRQIAVTPENVTIEFEISAQGPLNYIIVSLRAGDYQDVRQALLSTPQGRVPFLVPSEHTGGGFIYEIKDEAQRVLASGSGDFRQIAKGN